MTTDALIIGTYTESLAHVDGKAGGLLGASLSDGTVGEPALLAEVRNPSWVTVNRDGTRVYAVIETVEFEGQRGGGAIALARDLETGALTPLNTAPSAGVEPAHLALDPAERFLLEANYRTGSVAVFALGPDGELSEMVAHVQHEGSGPNAARQEQPHAHQVLFDPKTGRVLIPDLGLDSVFVYDFDAETGALTEVPGSRFHGTPGAGPRHLAFHPDGEHLFLFNELDNTLVLLAREGDGFAVVTSASTLPAGFEGHSQGAEVRVTPDGRFVLATNRGDLDSIAVFAVDVSVGTIELVHVEPSQGREPRDLVITGDGAYIVVANQNSDTLVTFALSDSAPYLTHFATTSVPTPVCVVPVP